MGIPTPIDTKQPTLERTSADTQIHRELVQTTDPPTTMQLKHCRKEGAASPLKLIAPQQHNEN